MDRPRNRSLATAIALAAVASILLVPMAEATPAGQDQEQLDYLLLATNRTSTMQEELREAAAAGFQFVGMTVSQTTFGGDEVVSILRRVRAGQ